MYPAVHIPRASLHPPAHKLALVPHQPAFDGGTLHFTTISDGGWCCYPCFHSNLPRLHSELVQSQSKMAALESQLNALLKEKNESITSLEKQRNTLLRKYKKAKSEIERLKVDLERAKVCPLTNTVCHSLSDSPLSIPVLFELCSRYAFSEAVFLP